MSAALSLFQPGEQPKTPTVATVVRAFLADQKTELNPSTYADRSRVCARFVADFGEREAETLRASECKAWILAKEEWQAANTRWGVANVLKRVMNWAVRDRLLRLNPIVGLRLPTGEPRRPTSEWEFQKMLAASSPCFRRVLIFLRATGCRPQDVRELCWEWINWHLRAIIIPSDKHKTGKRTRKPKVIVLPPDAFDPSAAGTAERLLHWLERPLAKPSGHVFRNTKGGQWTREAFSNHLLWIRKRTGIDAGATLHGIRHLVGTATMRDGGNLLMLSKGLGHASTAITERHYVNLGLNLEDLEAIRQTMQRGARRPRRVHKPDAKPGDQAELF